jgi:DNA-directed RNA polymerase subunit RPC12/RpoP
MPNPEPPSRFVFCTRCGEEVEVLGALSLIRHPYVCVQCLDQRHKETT